MNGERVGQGCDVQCATCVDGQGVHFQVKRRSIVFEKFNSIRSGDRPNKVRGGIVSGERGDGIVIRE